MNRTIPENEQTKALLKQIIKLCEDYQNADIEGQEIESWQEHTDTAIMNICRIASAAITKIQ